MIQKIKIFSLVFALMLLFASCEKWLDVNVDPNSPQEVEYEDLLASGISSIAYVMGGKYQVLGALWSQHWTQSPGASQYSGIDSYDINSSTYDGQFSSLYSGGLKNLEEVRLKSIADEENTYYLIATVMQCYAYQVLVDLYGEIPFSEALKGDKGIRKPIYEEGADVYDSLIARLDYALGLDYSDSDLKDPGIKDIVFHGSIEKWMAFANTLKLRIFIRQSNVNSAKAQQGIEEMYANNVKFLDQDAEVDLFTNESGRRNPIFDTEMMAFGGNPNLILSETFLSFLVENNDFVRLDNLFYTPADGGSHKGLIQGDYYAPDEPSGTNSSTYSKPIMRAEVPVYLISNCESYLLQCEAIVKYGVESYSDAKELFDNAMDSSYVRMGTATSSIPYSFPPDGSNIDLFTESIAIQKWVTLSGVQNLEAFFELNRTGFPVKSDVPGDNPGYEPGELTVSVNNVTSGKFPRRLIFPETEYANNPNTPAKKEVWEKLWWEN